jgi:hypothetical protein
MNSVFLSSLSIFSIYYDIDENQDGVKNKFKNVFIRRRFNLSINAIFSRNIEGYRSYFTKNSAEN